MNFNQIFSTLALLSLSAAAAVSGAKVLSVPVVRQFQVSSDAPTSLDKRSDEVNVDLSNQGFWYGIELGIGNPPQKVTFHIDTGSSDTWVDGKGFNPSKSSTYNPSRAPFQISYGDRSWAAGTFSTDDITIGGVTLKNGNFAYASRSHISADTYVSGIGYTSGEASTKEYSNLPVQLKEQGFVDRVAYSLWLNDFNDDKGSILFGGVDHAKYQGTLAKVPVVSNMESDGRGGAFRPKTVTRLSVNLNSIGFSLDGGPSAKVVDQAATPVLLDSGTSFGLLPQDWLDAIGNTLGAQWMPQLGLYVTENPAPEGTIDLDFSGVMIKSPLSGFIRPLMGRDGSQLTFDNGMPAFAVSCQSDGGEGVRLDDGTIYILGDSFLNGAYMVFDLESNEIGLANAKLGRDAKGSEVEAIGSAGIPGTKAPGYATATVSNSDYVLHTPTGFY